MIGLFRRSRRLSAKQRRALCLAIRELERIDGLDATDARYDDGSRWKINTGRTANMLREAFPGLMDDD